VEILSLALTFFIVANPIGNSPTILSLLRHYPFERQRIIMFRESVISLLIALFFLFFGEMFLNALHISRYSLVLTGGIVLFLLALKMIFHSSGPAEADQTKQEPFIVPIATPMISGAGLMTVIMVNAAAEHNNIKIFFAILIAWIGVTGVLVTSPYIQKLIGRNGMAALEQIMGMILGLISMNMIVDALRLFVQTQ